MGITYTKEQRAEAKKTGKRLCTVGVTGKGGKGYINVQLLCGDKTAKVLNDIITSLASKSD